MTVAAVLADPTLTSAGTVKQRIIPKFLLRDGKLVKGTRFHENFRLAGNPVTTAKVYDSYGVDEMIFLDIQASVDGRRLLVSTLENVASQTFMPLTAGGGVQTLEDVNSLLRAGADKIAVTTAAVQNPQFIHRAAERFGDQCMTVGIDYRRVSPGVYRVFTHGGTQMTDLDPIDFAQRIEDCHCGEILLCSIDRDGVMQGYDLDMMARAQEVLSVPLIISSGAGNLTHCLEALSTGVSAIAVGSMFLFTDNSPIKVRSYLRSHGVNVRASASSRN